MMSLLTGMNTSNTHHTHTQQRQKKIQFEKHILLSTCEGFSVCVRVCVRYTLLCTVCVGVCVCAVDEVSL
jgi:hypothetical protein